MNPARAAGGATTLLMRFIMSDYFVIDLGGDHLPR